MMDALVTAKIQVIVKDVKSPEDARDKAISKLYALCNEDSTNVLVDGIGRDLKKDIKMLEALR